MVTTFTDNLGINHRVHYCDLCHKVIVPTSTTPGYATDDEGNEICFDCCGELDRNRIYNLPTGGRTILYDAGDHATNWPGTFRVNYTKQRTGKHNIASTRHDVWFRLNGPNGPHFYHGTCFGNWTQILHVRRISREA